MTATTVLSFVYKAAAEIGELGDNTAAMREQVSSDRLLRLAMSGERSEVSVLGHTRWASVGIISEPNAHPVNSDEVEMSGGEAPGPYVVGVLNGDVDNHADLKAANGLRIAGPITTDAKVIPALVGRNSAVTGVGLEGTVEAFRRTVASFDGSVAIGAASAAHPGLVMLALRGSGQGVYIGVAEDRYVVASEPYGIVEETDHYVRLDGEQGGQFVALDGAQAGTLAGIARYDYNGSPAPVTAGDVSVAEVTTRDIDRGDAAHFLLKEISESPDSFAKTLRGRIVDDAGRLRAVVGERALPAGIAERLATGAFKRVKVIGQGTAAVAGRAVAITLGELLGDVAVEAVVATELSGFGLQLDMSDTLAIAVSQSGTTTDTNRTVDLLKARGAAVLAIVNRRSSDLTDKADGVMYTSDGRDIEMSVASTKAFYAQVAAGTLLACAISEAAGSPTEQRRHELLTSLRALPDAMRAVLARRATIAEVARRYAPTKRYWAVVGNGVNKVAAEELRIKLSELCYKAIACDVTEDKKHIDLSSEPLIFVCAAGLAGSTADDVGKEVAIFRAHKATPIVVADDGDARYPGVATIAVPPVDPALAFVLSTMAGHLFGYEAALAIDASAIPLREAREIIERAVGGDVTADAVLTRVRAEIGRPAEQYVDGLRNARYDGHLEASTAVRLAGLLRDVRSDHPVEEYQLESGKVGSPGALLDDLVGALTRAIEELTRPVDAIKHQAKTVTVGISRSDEGVIDRDLVQAVLAAGAGRDVLSYRTLKVLADLDPAVAEVVGFTRYGVDGEAITVVDRGGLSMGLASRVERRPVLSGTKRSVDHPARGARRPRAQRRSHGDLRAGGQGQRGDGDHLAARALSRPSRRGDDARRAAGLRPPLRPARRLGQRDRRRLRRAAARRAPRCRPADRADLGGRRSLAELTRPHCQTGLRDHRGWRGRRRRRAVPRVLARTPSMLQRLFTTAELSFVEPRIDPVRSLAARFAAREAVMKALGLGLGAFGFHDVSVDVADDGAPNLIVVGKAAELAAQRRVTAFHVSLSHDGPVAVAVVVADGSDAP